VSREADRERESTEGRPGDVLVPIIGGENGPRGWRLTGPLSVILKLFGIGGR